MIVLSYFFIYRLLSFILSGPEQPSPRPDDLNNSTTYNASSSSSSSMVILDAYPFPITKGCYVTIEQEYSSILPPSQQRSVQEAINIITTAIARAQLKGTKSISISVIPSLSVLFPTWVCFSFSFSLIE